MKNEKMMDWDQLHTDVISCRQCPRLVEWREKVAVEKRRAFLDQTYWGKPVPGFGDYNARILILGLAPGAHGSNRTGRMFTGDASGDFLFPALFKAGFASQSEALDRQDSLTLRDIYITAVCRCAPPGNKPKLEEQKNCIGFVEREMDLLPNLQGIVALGGIAFQNAYDLLKTKYQIERKSRPKFSHNAIFQWSQSPIWILSSYHPSRQNTQTGRLTSDMFVAIWDRLHLILEKA